MQTPPEHVTFRPGSLAHRLMSSPLPPGATAKRDLSRYHQLTTQAFDAFVTDHAITDADWEVVVAFIETREWVSVPYGLNFGLDWSAFLNMAMGKDFGEATITRVRGLLFNLEPLTIAAIIDRAESTALETFENAATGGATLAGL